MIKFFRHIRKSLISENKTGKYLKYAIGEIVLVMVGILLALQVNTWNNNRIYKKQLKAVFKQIQTDLEIDTTYITQIVKSFDEKDKRIQNIIDRKIKPSFYDTINALNYKDCKICRTESTTGGSFRPNTKGYNLLKSNPVFIDIATDSIIDAIDNFYTNAIPTIESAVQEINTISSENIKTLENYSWFADVTERKYNKEFLTFIFESQEYRNQLARYRIFYRDNYIKNLKYYKKLTPLILDMIEIELDKK